MAIYSYSRLSAFETCPRQYYYSYVAKIKLDKDVESIEAFLGSRVHETLEQLYRDVQNGRMPTRDELIQQYHEGWNKNYHDSITIVRRNMTSADYCRVGVKALEEYYDRYAPFDQSQTLALEQRVLFDLDGEEKYRLQGYVDRLGQRKDGTYEIHDYKTNSTLPTQADIDQNRQLALYQIGISRMWNDVHDVELVWHFVRFDKEMRSKRNVEQLDELRRSMITLIDDIESRSKAEEEYETCESKLCDWCQYQQFCPARKHLFQTASMPTEQFLQESGVQLVNLHTKLTTKIGQLKEEMEVLEEKRHVLIEALLAFAEREGLEVINGSDRQAIIEEQTKIVLPTKSDSPDEYAKLDANLRHSDCWDKVSAIDIHKLRRIWKGEEDDPGTVRQMLDSYVQEEKTKSVKFRRREDVE